TVAAMRARAEAMRQEELARALKRLGSLSEKEIRTVEALSEAIVNKMLHGPTARLKVVAAEKDGYVYVEAARRLWGLDDEAPKRAHRLKGLLGVSEKPERANENETGETLGC
ncbi:MAG TPA: glutamyl-tRNA reductase, partial [Coriobacteriia bacterium]